jgi:hypothetical protein
VLDEPVPQVDYRATSRRPQWSELPPAVRTLIEDVARSRVERAAPSVSSGFTGGFAALVRLADGREVFAKAGSGLHAHLVDAYAREAVALTGLPPSIPAGCGARRLSADCGRADAAAGRARARGGSPTKAPRNSRSSRPSPPGRSRARGAPAIRVHQRRYARTLLDWLAARRGWAVA